TIYAELTGSGRPQVRHALDVRSLRKHVQRDHLRYFKDIFPAQNVQISRHSGRLARDVNDLPRSDPAQQLQHLRPATLARWVEQNTRCSRVQAPEDLRQHLLRLAGHELAVGAAMRFRIAPCGFYGQLVVLDPDERINQIAQFNAEKTDPAVNVGQMTRAA